MPPPSTPQAQSESLSELLSQYSPIPSLQRNYSTLEAFACTSNDPTLSLSVTLKLLSRPNPALITYLQQLKGITQHNSIAGQSLIKILGLAYDPTRNLLAVIQQSAYTNLNASLKRCKRLEEQDAAYIAKALLYGQIEGLRASFQWIGDEGDIEITEGGAVKLGWNNSGWLPNVTNPLPAIIERLASRKEGPLPFPSSRILTDLTKVATQNASQISLHPLLKKRDKQIKKKGKGWIAVKQSKVKGEYGLQVSYLAASKQNGFVRVKEYQWTQTKSQSLDTEDQSIPPSHELLHFYRTNPCFALLYDAYLDDRRHYYYTVCAYCNDGSVLNYTKKLRNGQVPLTEPQIQFIFMSLLQPLKAIHKSPAVSLNMLHIRNIYLEDGIPVIGEPSPLSPFLVQALKDKNEVPDFYHREFKSMPGSRDPKFDTYSLGVLIYRLMYGEYPIFPDHRVHLPTTPTYKPQLKNAVELFLNRGGRLEEIQADIEVSEGIREKIKQNNRTDSTNLGYRVVSYDIKQADELSVKNQVDQLGKSPSTLAKVYHWLTTRSVDKQGKYQCLYGDEMNPHLRAISIVVWLLVVGCLVFPRFIYGLINALAISPTKYTVLISGVSQSIIITSYDTFQTAWQSIAVQNRTVQALTSNWPNGLGCYVDKSGQVFSLLKGGSPTWILWIAIGLITMVIILIIKAWQQWSFPQYRLGYHYYDTTIAGANTSRFALSSYLVFHVCFALILWSFHSLFNVFYDYGTMTPFRDTSSPLVGSDTWTNATLIQLSTKTNATRSQMVFDEPPCLQNSFYKLNQQLLSSRQLFSRNQLPPHIIIYLLVLMSFVQLSTSVYTKLNYNKLLNPIVLVWIPFILLTIVVRIVRLNGTIVDGGWIGEIAVLVGLILEWIITYIWFRCAKRGQSNHNYDENQRGGYVNAPHQDTFLFGSNKNKDSY